MAAWVLGLATLAAPRPAAAQPDANDGEANDADISAEERRAKQACVDAHEATQSAKAAGKLLDARKQALSCAVAHCPGVLREECSGFMLQLDRDIPTVSLRARDERGRDVLDVEVEVDGRLLTVEMEGTSLPLDPGRHRFRFEAEGFEPSERKVLVVEGQKNQLVEVTMEKVKPPPPPPEPPTDPMLVAGFVVGGLGVGGLVAFAVLGGIGLSERADLEQCRPCSDEEVAPVRTKLLAADIAMGTGLGALAIGAVLVGVSLSRDDAPAGGQPAGSAKHVRLELAPTPGGGLAAIRGRF
jgi:hypothetical protein